MWFEPVSTLDLIIKGLLIGVVASAPMGPVGVLCIQRTLNKGRWYGFVTGVGAAFSDIIYALVTGFGMSFVIDFIQNKDTLFYVQMGGSAMLVLFGLYMFRCDPAQSIRPTSHKKGTLAHNLVTGFLVTFSNPLILFVLMALFARFDFIAERSPALHYLVGIGCILVGATAWWLLLTYIVSHFKDKLGLRGLRLINLITGSVIVVIGCAGLIVSFF